MANMYALQSFTINVAGPPAHDDYVTIGDLRDSASQTVLGTPASFWQSAVPLTYGQLPGPLVGYLLNRPAGP